MSRVRQTSLMAYREIELDGTMGEQSLKILNFFKDKFPKDLTRNEISRELDIRINAVCGRINELHGAKWLEEVGKRRDAYSKKLNMMMVFNNKRKSPKETEVE